MSLEQSSEEEGNLVIIDTDAGIDDAWAILMLLAATKIRTNQYTKVLGITCVHGNSEVKQTCVNVLRTLEASKMLDVPVFKGASSPLIGVDEGFTKSWKPFFGRDGFGCADHESTPDLKLINEENAIVALSRLASEHVAVGNTTNCAEFNFHADPEAAYIVLNSAIKHKVLIPWETCCLMNFSLEWRDNVLGACKNDSVTLMNRVEKPLRQKLSFVDWVACDQVVAALLLNRAVVTESELAHLTVELHGHHTRGQVVVSHKFKREPNATIVKAVDKMLFSQLLLQVHTL